MYLHVHVSVNAYTHACIQVEQNMQLHVVKTEHHYTAYIAIQHVIYTRKYVTYMYLASHLWTVQQEPSSFS